MIAYLDLVAAIIDGERLVQREIDGGGILSVERDFGHALMCNEAADGRSHGMFEVKGQVYGQFSGR